MERGVDREEGEGEAELKGCGAAGEEGIRVPRLLSPHLPRMVPRSFRHLLARLFCCKGVGLVPRVGGETSNVRDLRPQWESCHVPPAESPAPSHPLRTSEAASSMQLPMAHTCGGRPGLLMRQCPEARRYGPLW